MDVKLPSGLVLQNLPDDLGTQQELAAYIYKAGLPRETRDKILQDMFNKPVAPSGLERFGRGFADVGQGVKQLGLMVSDPEAAKQYTSDINEDLARYEAGRGKDAGIDWLRLGGNVAATAPLAFVPGGQATLPARLLTGAAVGGTAAGSMFEPSGTLGGKAQQVAFGAAAGAVIPEGLRQVIKGGVATKHAVSRLYNSLLKLGEKGQQVFDIDGQLTAYGRQALESQGLRYDELTNEVKNSLLQMAKTRTGIPSSLTPEEGLRLQELKAVGIEKPTRGMVSRSPQDWNFERNVMQYEGIGDEIGESVKQAHTALGKQAEKIGSKLGTTSEQAAGRTLREAVYSKDQWYRGITNKAYQAAREQAGDQPYVSLEPVRKFLAENKNVMGTVPELRSAMAELDRIGAQMKAVTGSSTVSAKAKMLTVDQVEQYRQFLNNLYNPRDPRSSMFLGKLKDAVDESVFSSGAGDVFKEARFAHTLRKSDIGEQRLVSKIIEMKSRVDPLIADEDLASEVIKKSSIAELKQVKNTLFTMPPKLIDQAGKSWEDMRGVAFSYLLNKSQKTVGNQSVFSGANLKKAIADIGDEKLRVLFSPDELNQIKLLSRTAESVTTDVPFSRVNYSGTTPAMVNFLMSVGDRLPVVGRFLQWAGMAGKAATTAAKQAKMEQQAKLAMQPSRGATPKPDFGMEASRVMQGNALRATPQISSVYAESRRR